MKNEHLNQLANTWMLKHKLDSDNFDIAFRNVKDGYNDTVFVFVYNKAFARPFYHDKSAIAELILNSDFAFQTTLFNDSITVEIDKRGTLGGRHTWVKSLIGELEVEMDPTKVVSATTIEYDDSMQYWD